MIQLIYDYSSIDSEIHAMAKTKQQLDTLTVDAGSLRQIVAALGRIVPGRSSHPVLSNFLFDLGETVTATAFDLSVGVRMEIPSAKYSGEPQKICVPAKLLSDIMPHLSGDVLIKVDTEAGQLSIKAGRKFTIKYQGADDFPELTLLDEGSFKLSSDTVSDIAALLPFTSTDESKHVLCSVNFSIGEDGLKLAAADGHKLGWMEGDACTESDLLANIPRKTVEVLSKLAADETEITCTINAPTLAQFEGKGWLLTSRLIEGQYPNYQQLVPRQFSRVATLKMSEIKAAVKACHTMAVLKNNVGTFIFSGDSIGLSANCADVGDFDESIPCQMDGETLNIAFNLTYLLAALELVGGDTVTISMNTPTSSAVLNGGNQLSALLMPCQIRD